jgi:hypothetical protein
MLAISGTLAVFVGGFYVYCHHTGRVVPRTADRLIAVSLLTLGALPCVLGVLAWALG